MDSIKTLRWTGRRSSTGAHATAGTAWAALLLAVVACGDAKPKKADAGVDNPSDAGFVSEDMCPTLEPGCAPTAVPSFQRDVSPIIVRSCANIVGCHTGKANDPWPLNDYQDIVEWAPTFISDIQKCSMPPADAGIELSTHDRLILWQWLNCDTPRN